MRRGRIKRVLPGHPFRGDSACYVQSTAEDMFRPGSWDLEWDDVTNRVCITIYGVLGSRRVALYLPKVDAEDLMAQLATLLKPSEYHPSDFRVS